MARSSARIKRWRAWFGWFLLGSVILHLASTFVIMSEPPQAPPGPGGGGIGGQTLVLLTSLVTSVASLVGVIATTVLAWRKDKSDRAHSDADLELKKLEIEKRRKELVEIKAVPPAP